jgi:hypothetical protein
LTSDMKNITMEFTDRQNAHEVLWLRRLDKTRHERTKAINTLKAKSSRLGSTITQFSEEVKLIGTKNACDKNR